MGNPTGRHDWIKDLAGLGALAHPAAAGLMVMSNAYFASEWSTLKHHTLLFHDPTNAQRRSFQCSLKIANCLT